MRAWVRRTGDYVKLSTADDYNKLFTIIFVVWGVLDTATTYLGVSVYKTTEIESNPITQALFSIHPSAFFISKLFAFGCVILAAAYGKRYIQTMRFWKEYLGLVSITGFVIIARNIFTIIIGVRLPVGV